MARGGLAEDADCVFVSLLDACVGDAPSAVLVVEEAGGPGPDSGLESGCWLAQESVMSG